jgi:hypothetical protein
MNNVNYGQQPAYTGAYMGQQPAYTGAYMGQQPAYTGAYMGQHPAYTGAYMGDSQQPAYTGAYMGDISYGQSVMPRAHTPYKSYEGIPMTGAFKESMLRFAVPTNYMTDGTSMRDVVRYGEEVAAVGAGALLTGAAANSLYDHLDWRA